jgi:hypothetical protein
MPMKNLLILLLSLVPCLFISSITWSKDSNGSVNVQSYGAKCDGISDDTAAIQAAFNSVLNGGRVYLPACSKPYLISRAIRSGDKGFSIIGDGWQNVMNAPFGDPQWLMYPNYSGSVIVNKASGQGGLVLAGTHTREYTIRDIMLVGPGAGSSTGLQIGSSVTGSVQNHVENVQVVNFAVGVDLQQVEDSTFISLRTRGCGRGLTDSHSGSNQNVFYNFEADTDTTGISWLLGTDTVNFYGGLVQNATVNGAVFRDCDHCGIYGFHFEDSRLRGDGLVIDGVGPGGSNGFLVENNRFSAPTSAGPDISIRNATGTVLINNRTSSQGLVLEAAARQSAVISNNCGSYIDRGAAQGTGTLLIDPGACSHIAQISRSGVRLPEPHR